MNAFFQWADGRREPARPHCQNHTIQIPKEEIPAGACALEIELDEFTAPAGSDGCFLVPNIQQNACDNVGPGGVIRFQHRPDGETHFGFNSMPFFAVIRDGKGVLAVVSGMSLEYELIVRLHNGTYHLTPRFQCEGEPDEAIELKLLPLDEPTYSAAARAYRRYQLERGACLPLRERAVRYPAAGEAALGPMVRLRLAWKPVPSPVPEQTLENEPPLHVAITFDRVCEIIERFHRRGIRHAEFNLVGWNCSGHDGRWPDWAPVEPRLGGEAGLHKVIELARQYGYLISLHSNNIDSYSISSRLSPEDLLLDSDGNPVDGGSWGGGRCRRLCPKAAYRFAEKDFAEFSRWNLYGTHYIDVLSILRPDACFNPAHPLSRREAGEWRGRTLRLARESCGASSSEGAWDFCIGDMDYVLYAVFKPDMPLPQFCDEAIPLWHLVYHGILTYNSDCGTVNEAISPDPEKMLRNLECGGRPLNYFYSKFTTTNNNWMGEDDCSCGTDEELDRCVEAIARSAEEFSKRSDLQFEFIERHERLGGGLVRVEYSNGTVLLINHSATPQQAEGHEVAAHSYLRLDPRRA